MPPKMTEAEFDALLMRAGIPLTAAQKAGIHPVLGGLEAMQALIRIPLPEVLPLAQATAEPATTFSTEAGR
ncbi:MAG: hypothetical protein JWP04_129 [Belnapia sp.]|nr:hypothetical protein [Belnapia sp.]